MGGGLRRQHAVDAALAEALLVARETLGEVVAHERRRDRAARGDSEPAADRRRAQERHPIAWQRLPGLPDDARADLGDVALEGEALLHRQQDLADAEQADHGDEEVDAAQEIGRAEGHAQLARHRVHADAGQEQAEGHRDDDLVPLLPAKTDEGAERQEVDGEELRRAEAEREIGDPRGEEGDEQYRHERADEGGREGGGERLGGPPLLRHRVAVEGGRDRPRLARDVEQDRGDGAAEQRPPIDAGQHHDRRGRVHREGERQEDRDPVRAAEPGQHADEDAEHEPDHHERERLDREKDLKALKEELECLHRPSLSARRPLRAALSA